MRYYENNTQVECGNDTKMICGRFDESGKLIDSRVIVFVQDNCEYSFFKCNLIVQKCNVPTNCDSNDSRVTKPDPNVLVIGWLSEVIGNKPEYKLITINPEAGQTVHELYDSIMCCVHSKTDVCAESDTEVVAPEMKKFYTISRVLDNNFDEAFPGNVIIGTSTSVGTVGWRVKAICAETTPAPGIYNIIWREFNSIAEYAASSSLTYTLQDPTVTDIDC